MSRRVISLRMRARRAAYSLRSKGSGTISRILCCCGAGGSSDVLARIESVAHRLADEDEQGEKGGDGEKRGDAEPGRLQIVLRLPDQLAYRGRAGRQAEAEEVERGQRRDRAAHDE